MSQHIISRISILILAIVMAVFGLHHFRQPKDLVVFVPTYIPGGVIWVYLVGVAFIIAAIAFIANRYVKIAAYVLFALLFSFVLLIHLPNYLHAGDMEMRQMAFVSILKDLAMAAFALHIAANASNRRGFIETAES